MFVALLVYRDLGHFAGPQNGSNEKAEAAAATVLPWLIVSLLCLPSFLRALRQAAAAKIFVLHSLFSPFLL